MVVDLGTGSGKAVLRRARQHPDELVIGIDADAEQMADSSRRAAAAIRRGGVPNALFIVAPVEELPGPLAGCASLVTIALPWGSLLRGLLAADPQLVDAMKACLRPVGEVQILLSATDRDSAASSTLVDDRDAARLASAFEVAGLRIVEWRPADASDVYALSSGWGRRLGIPERRPAWFYRARTAPEERQPRAPSCTRRADGLASHASERGC